MRKNVETYFLIPHLREMKHYPSASHTKTNCFDFLPGTLYFGQRRFMAYDKGGNTIEVSNKDALLLVEIQQLKVLNSSDIPCYTFLSSETRRLIFIEEEWATWLLTAGWLCVKD